MPLEAKGALEQGRGEVDPAIFQFQFLKSKKKFGKG